MIDNKFKLIILGLSVVTNLKKAEFEVHGFVQGVGFRYFVYREAERLGLCGYCKNRYDGAVIVVAEGDEAKLKDLEEKLKIGPSRSRVEKVTAVYSDALNEYIDFDIR